MTSTERRFTPSPVEAVTDGTPRIAGYGAVFGRFSRDLGGFVETVDAGAFAGSRDAGWPDVVARYNHSSDFILGSTRSGTLTLEVDGTGLRYEVTPPESRRDVLDLVTRGDIAHSSFAFRATQDEWRTTDTNQPHRVLHEVELLDVAPVAHPAYPDATAGLRSLAEHVQAPLEEVRSYAEAGELHRFFTRTDTRSTPERKDHPMTDTTESTFLERLLTQRERIAGDLDQLDNRELTAREVEQRDTLERQLSETSTRIDDERDRLDRLEQANRTFHEHAAKPVTGPSKPVDPDAWRSVHTLVAEQRSGGLDVSRRAFVGGLTDEIVSPNLVSGIYPTAQPSILELFQRGEADGPVQRVYRAGTAATAGQVAEGDPKPDAGLTLEPVDIPMQKLATLQKVSDELRSDYSGFANAIPNELSRAIREQENAYAMSIINADSNVDTATASNVIDGTADAIASLYASSGQAASGMVLNPLDLASARKSKADTAGGYHLDPTSAAPMTLHGVPIVVSNSIDSGTVLVGAFESAGICFHRDAMRVAVGHSGDDFERNLTSVIVEERLGLGLTRPAFLTLLSISAA